MRGRLLLALALAVVLLREIRRPLADGPGLPDPSPVPTPDEEVPADLGDRSLAGSGAAICLESAREVGGIYPPPESPQITQMDADFGLNNRDTKASRKKTPSLCLRAFVVATN